MCVGVCACEYKTFNSLPAAPECGSTLFFFLLSCSRARLIHNKKTMKSIGKVDVKDGSAP